MEKVKLLDISMIATIFLIGAFALNIILIYDDKMRIINKRGIFPEDTANKIDVYNRIFLAGLFILYLYISVKEKDNAKREHKNLEIFDFSILSSILIVIAGFITLYVVAAAAAEGQTEVVNPEL